MLHVAVCRNTRLVAKLVVILVANIVFMILSGQDGPCYQVENVSCSLSVELFFCCGLMTSHQILGFQDFARPGMGGVSKLKNCHVRFLSNPFSMATRF